MLWQYEVHTDLIQMRFSLNKLFVQEISLIKKKKKKKEESDSYFLVHSILSSLTFCPVS